MSRPAVYTIVNRALVNTALEKGQCGELFEAKRWASAAKAWHACVEADERYLLLLGDAAEIRGVEWVAEVDAIDGMADGRTRVAFSRLRALKQPLPRRQLRKASDGVALSDDYMRPYVPCTLTGSALRAVQSALAGPAKAQEDADTVSDDQRATGATERAALAAARIGQGAYRTDLMRLWQGRCAVTGCAIPQVLIASHAKPWRDATDEGRLDPFNGLLLAAQVDRLFDAGLISFDDEGRMLVKPTISAADLLQLGVPADARLRELDERHRPYLAAHRIAHGYRETSQTAPGESRRRRT